MYIIGCSANSQNPSPYTQGLGTRDTVLIGSHRFSSASHRFTIVPYCHVYNQLPKYRGTGVYESNVASLIGSLMGTRNHKLGTTTRFHVDCL